MKLSKDQAQKIAALANLALSQDEAGKLCLELSAILEYVDQLNELDTTDVSPTAQLSGPANVFREDAPDTSQSLSQTEAVANSPQKRDGFFATKPVFERRGQI